MATYKRADSNVMELIDQMKTQYHSELDNLEVTVDCLLAYGTRNEAGFLTSPAITKNGVQCDAIVRITSLKDRVKGMADVEMLIDGDQIDDWNQEELGAIIDHELTHVALATDNEGNPKSDDIGRPKLKMIQHDYEFGFFNSVARRHGHASAECRNCRRWLEMHETVQLYLPGFELVAEKRSRKTA